MACKAVLETYGLIEHIVSFLPSKDNRRAQRVAKAWQKIIMKSIIICKARCLPHKTTDDYDVFRVNCSDQPQHSISLICGPGGLDSVLAPVVVHPIFEIHEQLTYVPENPDHTPGASGWWPSIECCIMSVPKTGHPKLDRCATKGISEPFVQVATVALYSDTDTWLHEHAHKIWGCSLRRKTGVTVGDIVWAQEHLTREGLTNGDGTAFLELWLPTGLHQE